MQIIGHRGASGYAPENTLKAFELALSQGCEWLELDVHLLDGKLIVIGSLTQAVQGSPRKQLRPSQHSFEMVDRDSLALWNSMKIDE